MVKRNSKWSAEVLKLFYLGRTSTKIVEIRTDQVGGSRLGNYFSRVEFKIFSTCPNSSTMQIKIYQSFENSI